MTLVGCGERYEDDLLSRYNDLLDRRPVLTKAITAAAVQAVGAALGSALSATTARREARKREFFGISGSEYGAADRPGGSGVDWTNVLAFGLHGALLNGPVGHYW